VRERSSPGKRHRTSLRGLKNLARKAPKSLGGRRKHRKKKKNRGNETPTASERGRRNLRAVEPYPDRMKGIKKTRTRSTEREEKRSPEGKDSGEGSV